MFGFTTDTDERLEVEWNLTGQVRNIAKVTTAVARGEAPRFRRGTGCL